MASKKKKLSIGLTIFLLVLLLLLAALPYAIKWTIIHQLEARGADQASIEDVNFNPFTGELVVQNLQVGGDAGPGLSAMYAFVDIDWLALFDRHIHIRRIELNNAGLTLRLDAEGRWYLGGLEQPVADGPASPAAAEPAESGQDWTLGIDSIALTDTRLDYVMPQWQAGLTVAQLELHEFSTRHRQQATTVAVSGSFNGAPLDIEAEFTALTAQPEYRLKTELQGLDLTGFAPFLPQPMELRQASLSTDGDWVIRQTAGTGWVIRHDGRFALQDIDVAHPQIGFNTAALSWDGSSRIEVNADAKLGIELEGTLDNGATRLAMPTGNLAAAHERLTFSGKAALPDLNAIDALSLNGELHASKLAVNQSDPALMLAEAETLDLIGIALDGLDRITLEKLAIESLAALTQTDSTQTASAGEQHSPLAESQHLELVQLSVQDRKRLDIEQVDLGKSRFHLQRMKDGGWQGLAALKLPALAAEDTPAEPDEPFTFAVGQIALAEGSRLAFTDNRVDPGFSSQVDIKRFLVSELDSGSPDHPAQLDLDAASGKYAILTAKGTLKPFAEALDTSLDARIEQLELHPLSPYFIQLTGYAIHSGTLNADSDIDINNAQLDIHNDLKLNQLTVEPASPEEAEKLDQALAMPLDKALDMLRDSDDNIELDLPVTGSLNNPNFDASDAINQALAKALKTAAVTYIKYALQPYGTLLAVGQLVGSKLGNIQLEPIAFPPGQAELTAQGQDYLSRIGQLMSNRPELSLKICGHAAPADRTALQEVQQQAAAASQPQEGRDGKDKTAAPPEPPPIPDQRLLDLAEQRGFAVKDRLIQADGIATDRLFTCRPDIDTQAQAEPRVDLGL